MTVYVEIVNEETGASIRIPDSEFYLDEKKDRVGDFDEYTRPKTTTAAEIDELNGENHFLFGTWEMLCQNRKWREAITAVQEGCSNENLMIYALRSTS